MLPGVVSWSMPEVHSMQCGWVYSFRAWPCQLIPLPSIHGGEGSSFPGFIPPNEKVKSKLVIRVEPDDSGAIIEYQFDNFAHTWTVAYFVAQSQIYLRFTGKLQMLTNFLLELGCKDNSF